MGAEVPKTDYDRRARAEMRWQSLWPGARANFDKVREMIADPKIRDTVQQVAMYETYIRSKLAEEDEKLVQAIVRLSRRSSIKTYNEIVKTMNKKLKKGAELSDMDYLAFFLDQLDELMLG